VKKILFPLLLFAFLFISCKQEELRLLDRESLFTLPLGVMADELDYLYRERVFLPGTSDIFMKEGIVYISSENMAKVMGFNSYGDLLTLLYNTETNPLPREVVLADEEQNTNKRFVPWSFSRPGQLGLSGKHLLVEDRVTGALVYFDEKLQAACDRILLRFDDKGNYLDYVGQEGIGGKPFPYIHDIAFRDNGEFAVISRLDKGWWVFWYSPEGELLYQVDLNQEYYPFFKEGFQSFIPNLVVDPVEYRLFLMVNYYSINTEDETPQTKRIYQFDLNSQNYNEGAAVSDEVIREGGEDIRYVFELVGATRDGQVLMISPVDYNRYVIAGMDDSGKFLFKREISIGENHSVYTTFQLSADGILTSLCYQQEQAEISWWRTDRLFRQ